MRRLSIELVIDYWSATVTAAAAAVAAAVGGAQKRREIGSFFSFSFFFRSFRSSFVSPPLRSPNKQKTFSYFSRFVRTATGPWLSFVRFVLFFFSFFFLLAPDAITLPNRKLSEKLKKKTQNQKNKTKLGSPSWLAPVRWLDGGFMGSIGFSPSVLPDLAVSFLGLYLVLLGFT